MDQDPLTTHYENELAFLRKLGSEFARQRPKIADRLNWNRETGVAEDPHVERLIESFAFLTARVRLKLEDEFPELTEALLGTLYPHYLAPIPSMCIVHFDIDPDRGKLPKGHTIARHSRLFSREVHELPCRFRTAYPLTLWPVEVSAVQYQTTPFGRDVELSSRSQSAKSMIRLELSTGGGTNFSELEIDNLRFYINGDLPLVHRIYELLFNHAVEVVIRGENPRKPAPLVLGPRCLRPVGFERDEGLLPYGSQSFHGYRLLTEYFSFPQKFLFFELADLTPVRSAGFGQRLEVLIFLNRAVPNLESQVNRELFRLGCVPAVNLFEQDADPISLSHVQSEYQVIPDVRFHWATEVYSVDAVQSTRMDTGETVAYRPFYSFKHAAESRAQRAYWYMTRRASVRKNDPGTEVYLSLVDLAFQPTLPPAEVLTIKVTCTNRDLPNKLRAAGGEDWEFQLEGQSPTRRILPLVLPTAPARLPFEQLRWRLMSHLALNHLSLTDGEQGAQALREILKLYDYAATRATAQHIDGIASVSSRRRVAPVSDGSIHGFCRGVEVEIELDPEKFAGGGAFLFMAVLERFIGLYASINSVTRLLTKFKQQDGYLKIWPYRTGEQIIL